MRALIVGEEQPDGEQLESLRDRTAAEIERGDEEIEDWPLKGAGFDLLRPGLKRAYARGRKRFREARRDPTDATSTSSASARRTSGITSASSAAAGPR